MRHLCWPDALMRSFSGCIWKVSLDFGIKISVFVFSLSFQKLFLFRLKLVGLYGSNIFLVLCSLYGVLGSIFLRAVACIQSGLSSMEDGCLGVRDCCDTSGCFNVRFFLKRFVVLLASGKWKFLLRLIPGDWWPSSPGQKEVYFQFLNYVFFCWS